MNKNIFIAAALALSLVSCVSNKTVETASYRIPADTSPPVPMAIIGDAGLSGDDLNALEGSLSKEKVSSLILPGDNLYFGTYNLTWGMWKRRGFKFDVVALGNHHKGYQNEMNYFAMPGEFYSVVKNGARFIVLNSDNENNLDEQFDWLQTEIHKAKENLIFLVYHHPTFSSGSDDSWTQKEHFQKRMREFFKSNGQKISAVLLGHAHISAAMNFGSIPAIVSGSGREVLKAKRVSYFEDNMQIQTVFLAPRTQHWAKLEISADAKLATIHFVRVADQYMSCTIHIGHGAMTLDQSCAANSAQ